MIPVLQNPASNVQRFVVGSYTEPYGPFRAIGDGISLVSLHPTGKLATLAHLALPNPAYLRPLSADRIAVAIETDDERASIALVRVEADALELEDRIAAPGRIPCHVDLHSSGRWLAGACYGTGEVFALPLTGGRLQPDRMVSTRHAGSSVHPVRQTGPHPHAARFSPDGAWLIVPDLGTDKIAVYPFDETAGPDFSKPSFWPAPAGSGPRLPLFSLDGGHVVLVEEIASRLVSLRWNDGRLSECQRISSLIEPFPGENTAAGLRWHPSGHLIGVSNRGADAISLFAFDPETGRLTPWHQIPSGGVKPRDFEFSSCGTWLITTNQNGDCLAVYSIEQNEIRDTGERLTVRSPSCIRQMPDSDS